MATQVQRPSINGSMTRKPPTPRTPVKKNVGQGPKRAPKGIPQKASPVVNKAHSVAGESPANGVSGAYAIMASRIANRIGEMAENLTFSERERPKPQEPIYEPEDKKRPRKLEMRLNGTNGGEQVSFSAPFLDNTLQKMLELQNRMLKTTADLSKSEGVTEKMVREHASQSAELSRIIAMICAEKARQGA